MCRWVRVLVTRLLAVLVVALVTGVATAGPAMAGGPTSVLLASPYSDSAAAMYYGDDDYARLSRVNPLGPSRAASRVKPRAASRVKPARAGRSRPPVGSGASAA